MTHPVLIVGAGLSGLSAAWHCHRSGLDFRLIEARDRVGGRAWTQKTSHGAFDLGPSWVWHGQPYVAQLLQHFSLASYDQYCDGELLHQTPDGQVHRNAHLKPMQHAQRIEGGVGSLVTALAQDLPAHCLQLNTSLQSVISNGEGTVALLKSAQGEEELKVKALAVAIPPRLLASIDFQPAVSHALNGYIAETPTWMAAQAKFFAVYSRPFWRQAGFSGDAFSSTGVLAEIHDASAPQSSGAQSEGEGAYYALFGFVRLNAEERMTLGSQAVCDLAVQQLTELFGDEASQPVETILQDWSTEPLTAARADRQALSQHPLYRPAPAAGDEWAGILHLIAAETSAQSGGLIEGALQRGAEFAHACTQLPD